MLPEDKFVCIYSHETHMKDGRPLGVKVLVAAGREPTDSEKNIAWKMGEQVFNEVWKQHTLTDPLGIESAAKEKEDILKLFEGKNIFVEEIPNGYCSQPCCCNLPWFIVTTPIGHIKIGWRKRVINIDWTNTLQKKKGKELFPNEEVTMDNQWEENRYIHAWGYEKAKEYLDKIHEVNNTK